MFVENECEEWPIWAPFPKPWSNEKVAFNAVVSSHLDIGDWKKAGSAIMQNCREFSEAEAAQWLKRMVIRNLTPVRMPRYMFSYRCSKCCSS